MKVNFEEIAIDVLSANYPNLKFDLNVEHVNEDSAMFVYDDENGVEWKVDLEVISDEDDDGELIYILEWSIKGRPADKDDWYEEISGEKEL